MPHREVVFYQMRGARKRRLEQRRVSGRAGDSRHVQYGVGYKVGNIERVCWVSRRPLGVFSVW